MMIDNSRPIDWSETLQILDTSKQLAVGFNQYLKTDNLVSFVPVEQAKDITDGLEKTVTIEKYIKGNYKKWCNNYGFNGPSDLFMPAFAHWSWAHTKGEIMIADL